MEINQKEGSLGAASKLEPRPCAHCEAWDGVVWTRVLTRLLRARPAPQSLSFRRVTEYILQGANEPEMVGGFLQ